MATVGSGVGVMRQICGVKVATLGTGAVVIRQICGIKNGYGWYRCRCEETDLRTIMSKIMPRISYVLFFCSGDRSRAETISSEPGIHC